MRCGFAARHEIDAGLRAALVVEGEEPATAKPEDWGSTKVSTSCAAMAASAALPTRGDHVGAGPLAASGLAATTIYLW